MAVSFNKYNIFVADICNKVHNLGADTLKIALSNTAPSAAHVILTDVTAVSLANATSVPASFAPGAMTSTQTSGTYKLILTSATTNLVITATGAVGPFRYIILYNDTPTSPVDPLIGWWDYGSAITLQSGDTFTIDWDDTNGILQLV